MSEDSILRAWVREWHPTLPAKHSVSMGLPAFVDSARAGNLPAGVGSIQGVDSRLAFITPLYMTFSG